MKEHLYKGKLIKNIKYKSENRWFILEQNGENSTISGRKVRPFSTLKEAKEYLDRIIDLID